jgi:hypothetical protein
MAAKMSSDVVTSGTDVREPLVEVMLFLTRERVEALKVLSRRRRQSVAQIVRGWIDEGLFEAE